MTQAGDSTHDFAPVLAVFAAAVGLMVEAVSDLVQLDAASLQAPPTMGDEAILTFIEGLAAVGDRMIQVLNLPALVGMETPA